MPIYFERFSETIYKTTLRKKERKEAFDTAKAMITNMKNMKRIISAILILLLAVSICACKDSAEKNEDPIAKKVSEYAELKNKDLSESIETLPTCLEYDETTIECYKAEGRDLVYVRPFDSSVASMWTQEIWEEYARTNDRYNNTLFKNLTETVGDDSVRLIIRFIDNDDNVLYDHIIDKNYKSSAGTITIIDDTDEAEYAVKAAAKYCSENAERLNAELSTFMEEDAKWNGCHAEESDIVFEFKYNKAVDSQEFESKYSQADITAALQRYADEIASETGTPLVKLVFRCIDSDGNNIAEMHIKDRTFVHDEN